MDLDDNSEWHFELLHRQYLQLWNPTKLAFPPPKLLGDILVQKKIYSSLFSQASNPPDFYKLKVLKSLAKAIEEIAENDSELEICDEILELLGQLIALPESAAQPNGIVKMKVTYTVPEIYDHANPGQIIILESPTLLSYDGETGTRTWEAALILGSYLYNNDQGNIKNCNVLELGAGTGFLSLLCAVHMHANYVLATDGSLGIVHGIERNISLNISPSKDAIHATTLEWGGQVNINSLQLPASKAASFRSRGFDLILGADVIYEADTSSLLVKTLACLLKSRQAEKAFIAATVRNENTLENFIRDCNGRRTGLGNQYISAAAQADG